MPVHPPAPLCIMPRRERTWTCSKCPEILQEIEQVQKPPHYKYCPLCGHHRRTGTSREQHGQALATAVEKLKTELEEANAKVAQVEADLYFYGARCSCREHGMEADTHDRRRHGGSSSQRTWKEPFDSAGIPGTSNSRHMVAGRWATYTWHADAGWHHRKRNNYTRTANITTTVPAWNAMANARPDQQQKQMQELSSPKKFKL